MNAPSSPSSPFPNPSGSSVFISVIAILGCFALFLLILFLAYLPNRETAVVTDLSKVEEDQRWKFTAEGRAGRLAELRGREQQLLTTYGWVDQPAGVVRLPINRAMELFVQEQQARPSR